MSTYRFTATAVTAMEATSPAAAEAMRLINTAERQLSQVLTNITDHVRDMEQALVLGRSIDGAYGMAGAAADAAKYVAQREQAYAFLYGALSAARVNVDAFLAANPVR